MSAEREGPSLPAAVHAWWLDQRRSLSRSAALARLARELWEFARDSTPERERQRYGDVEYDWGRAVNTTSATVGWRDRLLGVFHSAYQPTEPAVFHEMLDGLRIDYGQFMFVDIGSGKGRTLLLASDYPFRRILGVELLPELNRIAQENIRVYRSETQKCFAIESICGDARKFHFPAEPTLLYLFNPLFESALARVMRNLESSLQEYPREAFVIYHNPLLAHVIEQESRWVKLAGSVQYAAYRFASESSSR